MTTVINNPSGRETSDSSGVGIIVGVILAIVIIALALMYGLPYLRGGSGSASQPATGSLNVDIPNVGSGSVTGSGSTGGQ